MSGCEPRKVMSEGDLARGVSRWREGHGRRKELRLGRSVETKSRKARAATGRSLNFTVGESKEPNEGL